jgi:hypothetical protein
MPQRELFEVRMDFVVIVRRNIEPMGKIYAPSANVSSWAVTPLSGHGGG